MKFINLTNHDVTEITSGNTYKQSGQVARAHLSSIKDREFDGVPIYSTQVNGISGLPEPKEGVMYIVSALTMKGVPATRVDVVSPGNTQRDANNANKVVGCIGFRSN